VVQPAPRGFVNIERLLAGIYAPMLGGPEFVGNQTPDNLEQLPHYLRVMRVGGPQTALYDYPIVEFDFFAPDEATGWPLVSSLVGHLLQKPPPHPAIDVVVCDPAPRELPWGDGESVRHWGATLFFELRQVRLPVQF